MSQILLGLLWCLKWLRSRLQSGRPGLSPWVGKISWRRAQQPTPVFLPGGPSCLESTGSQRAGHDRATKHTDTTDSTDVITCMFSHFSRVRPFETLWTVARQAPLSMGCPRQEHWRGLPCPPPGDLPNPGIEPLSPALQVDSLSLNHWEKPSCHYILCLIKN